LQAASQSGRRPQQASAPASRLTTGSPPPAPPQDLIQFIGAEGDLPSEPLNPGAAGAGSSGSPYEGGWPAGEAGANTSGSNAEQQLRRGGSPAADSCAQQPGAGSPELQAPGLRRSQRNRHKAGVAKRRSNAGGAAAHARQPPSSLLERPASAPRGSDNTPLASQAMLQCHLQQQLRALDRLWQLPHPEVQATVAHLRPQLLALLEHLHSGGPAQQQQEQQQQQQLLLSEIGQQLQALQQQLLPFLQPQLLEQLPCQDAPPGIDAQLYNRLVAQQLLSEKAGYTQHAFDHPQRPGSAKLVLDLSDAQQAAAQPGGAGLLGARSACLPSRRPGRCVQRGAGQRDADGPGEQPHHHHQHAPAAAQRAGRQQQAAPSRRQQLAAAPAGAELVAAAQPVLQGAVPCAAQERVARLWLVRLLCSCRRLARPRGSRRPRQHR
jgi:hypothetical protein